MMTMKMMGDQRPIPPQQKTFKVVKKSSLPQIYHTDA